MTQTSADTPSSPLLRVLGTGFGVATVLGSVIGVGILRVPSELAHLLGDPVLFIGIWLLGALLAALGANCLAELSVMLPKAGGPYVYIRRAYGDYPGFLAGWLDWCVSVGSAAFVLVALGEYGLRLIPAFPGGNRAISLCAIALLFTVHSLGVRAGSRAQNVLSLSKALAFLFVVGVCLTYGGDTAASPHPSALAPPAPTPAMSIAFLLVLSRAAMMVNETYAGWFMPVYMAEENHTPERSLPRALFVGIALVAALYLLINLALLKVLSLEEIAATNLPLAEATARAVGPSAGLIITVVAVVSLLGLCNAILFQSPRILYALAKDGWFHSAAFSVSAKGTPQVGLAISAAVMIVLAMTGTFEQLFISIALLGLAVDALVYSSVLWLRRKEPDLPRPYRAVGYPLLPGLALLIALAIIVGTALHDPWLAARGGAVLLLSVPAFIWAKSRRAA